MVKIYFEDKKQIASEFVGIIREDVYEQIFTYLKAIGESHNMIVTESVVETIDFDLIND